MLEGGGGVDGRLGLRMGHRGRARAHQAAHSHAWSVSRNGILPRRRPRVGTGLDAGRVRGRGGDGGRPPHERHTAVLTASAATTDTVNRLLRGTRRLMCEPRPV